MDEFEKELAFYQEMRETADSPEARSFWSDAILELKENM